MKAGFRGPLSYFLALVLASSLTPLVTTLNKGYWHYDGEFESDVNLVLDHRLRKRDAPSKPGTLPVGTSVGPVQVADISTATEGFLNETALGEVLDHGVIVPEDKINETIRETLSHGGRLNQTGLDNHKYYRARFFSNPQLWVDLDSMDPSLVNEHKMLSKSYRRAATIPLTFNFPFYGHEVTNVTIATGGFLYTGDYVHAWLAATQYIAPLMANFDTSQSDNSKIRYVDNGTALIVEWKNVRLKGSDSKPLDIAPFSFQVILHSNGDIVFAYESIPVAITVIGDKDHPVKVGLSDAYIIDRTIFFVRRKTIYEYHRMDLKEHEIGSSSAIYFKALATCNGKLDCQSCIDTRVEDPSNKWGDGTNLDCMWCPALNRCSDGMDRLRQKWLMSSCDTYHRKKGANECGTVLDNTSYADKKHGALPTIPSKQKFDRHEVHKTINGVEKKKLKSYGGHYHAGIVIVSVVLVLALSLTVWFVYAYFFPHSWSGQLLIKYRPSHWQWRRAEPRYTAASIHM